MHLSGVEQSAYVIAHNNTAKWFTRGHKEHLLQEKLQEEFREGEGNLSHRKIWPEHWCLTLVTSAYMYKNH